MTPDEAHENYRTFVKDHAVLPDFTETDTRCKMIDRVFKECLGWPEKAINRETHVQSGFMDYRFSLGSVTHLVLEAKRSGIHFEVPNSLNRRNYKVNGVISTVDTLKEAISQARRYCVDNGSKYAVVSNGYQYVIFAAFVPGRPWEDATCIVFNSLQDIDRNFSLFWNLLSYESVGHGSLVQYLDKKISGLQFGKIIDLIHNRDQKWERNRLYLHLRPIADFVFNEIIDEAKTDLLKTCYVFDRSNRGLGDEIENLFQDRLPYYAQNFKIKDIFERKSRAGVFEDQYAKYEKEGSNLPLAVLLGGVGCGKSTFLHRFFKVVVSYRETLVWFYVDFRVSPFSESMIEDFVFSQLIRDFQAKYSATITPILDEIGFEITEENKRATVTRLFALLKRLGFSPAIVIDNVDQHEFSFQEKLFIFSNHLCSELKTTTILALREETFVHSTRDGVFDAYHVPTFHISAPNFLSMVRPRIQFAKRLLSSDEILKAQRIKTRTREEIVRFFDILERSLSKDNDQSRRIVNFFDSVSVGNMRQALRMFSNFLVSGNTNVGEMFSKERDESGDTYQIAFHQLLKSIMLGEYKFYCSERSQIANVFDFDTSISDSHFNQLRVLNYCQMKRNSKSPIGRGYVTIDEILLKAEEVTLLRDAALDTLSRLSSYGLIEYDNQSPKGLDTAVYAKITPSGFYYLNEMIFQFGYIDNVVVDTPIADSSLLRTIRHSLNEYAITTRLDRTKLFVGYLVESEKQEISTRPQLLQTDFGNKLFAVQVKTAFKAFVRELEEKGIIKSAEAHLV